MHLPTHTRMLPLLCCLLSGCSINPYTVTLNNNVLYTPNEALRNAVLQDPGLQACLNQTLARNAQSDPAAVTLLACPGAGVQSLAGIDALVNLEQLELSDNTITNLSPLLPLKKLRVLSLRNNSVGDIRPLDSLPILRFLSLEGNNRIPCPQLDEFQAKLGNTFNRPQTCVN
jgi:Leucine-rich repeat (LRR) protein